MWHQLTLKLTEFVKNDYFAQNGGLVEVTVKKTYSCAVLEINFWIWSSAGPVE